MKEEGGKLVPISLEGLEFENDFGQSPIGLGHFSQDQGFIAVASLVGFFIGCAVTGNVLAGVLVIVAGLNDIGYAKRKTETPQPDPNVEESAIDVEARVVDDAPKQIGATTKLNAVEVGAETIFVSSDPPNSETPAVEVTATPITELKVSDSLGEPLKSIWLFAKKKNCWVTVRNIYDQKMKVLEGKKVEQIHQYLGLLADIGLGEIDEEGKSHSSVGFRAY